MRPKQEDYNDHEQGEHKLGWLIFYVALQFLQGVMN